MCDSDTFCSYASGTEEGQQEDKGPPQRPEFPSPDLGYFPLFPPELPEDLGSKILIAWNFLHSFQNLLGIPYMTFTQLLQALLDGQHSQQLGDLHMSMIRIIQADMEEAHATGAMQVSRSASYHLLLSVPLDLTNQIWFPKESEWWSQWLVHDWAECQDDATIFIVLSLSIVFDD